MSDDEIRRIVREVIAEQPPLTEAAIHAIVAASVAQTMTRLGIDTAQPFELQADMRWVRQHRETESTWIQRVAFVAIGVLTTGILIALWDGIKSLVHK